MPSTNTESDLTLRIRSHREGAHGVAVLTLEDPTGAPLPSWEPGAHVDLHLGGDTVRQYSLCGTPADHASWRVAVLRDPNTRGGSSYVHDSLRDGDLVRVRGPRNNYPLVPARQYIFIAGGIGITPLIPMIRAAQAADARWTLHYGGRNRASMAFLEELTSVDGGEVSTYPHDEVGLLPLTDILGAGSTDTLVYCCGPGVLLDAVEEHCAQHWPAESLHVERFSPRTRDDAEPNRAFEVELAASGTTVVVPADLSILQAVEAAGIDVPSSCHEGTCGTCETAVLDGDVDHRDSLLSPAEQAANESMFICVSRARSRRLVLDL